MHGPFGKGPGLAKRIDPIGLALLRGQMALGDDHRGLPVLFGGDHLFVSHYLGLPHQNHPRHRHMTLVGFIFLRQHLLAGHFVGNSIDLTGSTPIASAARSPQR